MRLISDPATHAYKVRQVVTTSSLVVAVLVGTFYFRTPRPSIGEELLIVLMFAGILAFIMRRRLWFVADAVSEDGASLVIRRGRKQVTLPLYAVSDVYPVNFYYTREGLALTLRMAVEPFGTEIVFLPPEWQVTSREQMDQVATELKSRLGIVAA